MQDKSNEPRPLQEFRECSVSFNLVFLVSENIKSFTTYQFCQANKYNLYLKV